MHADPGACLASAQRGLRKSQVLKELCKLKKKELQAILPGLAEALGSCQFLCRKCARVAPEKNWLCKPLLISKLLAESAEPRSIDAEQGEL